METAKGRLIPCLLMAVALAAIYFPVTQAHYLFHDDYYFFAWTPGVCKTHPQYYYFSLESGRPLWGWIQCRLGSLISRVSDANFVRAIAISILWSFAVSLYLFLGRLGWGRLAAFCVALMVATLPAYQAAVAMVSNCFHLVGAFLGIMAFRLWMMQKEKPRLGSADAVDFLAIHGLSLVLFTVGLGLVVFGVKGNHIRPAFYYLAASLAVAWLVKSRKALVRFAPMARGAAPFFLGTAFLVLTPPNTLFWMLAAVTFPLAWKRERVRGRVFFSILFASLLIHSWLWIRALYQMEISLVMFSIAFLGVMVRRFSSPMEVRDYIASGGAAGAIALFHWALGRDLLFKLGIVALLLLTTLALAWSLHKRQLLRPSLMSVLVGLTFYSALLLYPPGAMMYWFALGTYLVSTRRKELSIYATSAFPALTAIVVYAIYCISARSARLSVATHWGAKAQLFWRTVCFDALNFWNVFPRGSVSAGVAAILLLGAYISLRRSQRWTEGIVAAILLPLAFLPSLAAGENTFSYHTQAAITSLLLVYVVIALARLVRAPIALSGFLVTGATMAGVIAHKNIQNLYAVPHSRELRTLEHALANIDSKLATIYIVRPKEAPPRSRYDEFGVPTSFYAGDTRWFVTAALREVSLGHEAQRVRVESVLEPPVQIAAGEMVIDLRATLP